MGFKQYLISTGVTEEQASKIVEGMPQNKLFIASEEKLDERYAVLKGQKEQSDNDLADANKLVTTLQKSNKDNEELQTKINDYKTQVDTLQAERQSEQTNYALKDALAQAGVKDVDYGIFKLGEVELGKDGKIKDLDNKVKSLKESSPDMFKAKEPVGKGDNGYKPVDNKLETGNTGKAFTLEEIGNMSTKEINDNWDAIGTSLENGGNE